MLGKLAEMTVRDFRGFMKECYPIAWEIIGVGGREDIISTLGSLIECNQEMGKPKNIDDLSDEMKEELFGTPEV